MSVYAAYEVNRAPCAGGDARGSIAAASLHAGPMLASARMRQGLCFLRARPDIRGRIPLTSADGPSPRTRIGWSDQGTGAPYSAPSASPVRRELPPMPSARSATARPATRADPVATAMSTGAPSHGSPKRIVRRGSGRRLGRLAFVASERALQFPRLVEDPGGTQSVGRRMPPWHRRSRWGPRSTGASAPARFPGAARPGRHEPAEPVLATLGAGQRRAGSGGTAIIAGLPAAAAYVTTAGVHGVERHRKRDRRACRTRMGSEKGNTWLYRSAKSHVINARYEERTVDPASTDFRFPAPSGFVQIRSLQIGGTHGREPAARRFTLDRMHAAERGVLRS